MVAEEKAPEMTTRYFIVQPDFFLMPGIDNPEGTPKAIMGKQVTAADSPNEISYDVGDYLLSMGVPRTSNSEATY